MKVYKSFAENMWPYFNSFAVPKVDVNVDNILVRFIFI